MSEYLDAVAGEALRELLFYKAPLATHYEGLL
jgi:hypothetical protein